MTSPAPAAADVLPPPEAAPAFTPVQLRTFDELLSVGTDRPVVRDGFVAELEAHIKTATAAAVAAWTEPTFWLGKALLFSTLDCEGKVAAEREVVDTNQQLHPSAAVGIAAHHAIQVAQTHRGAAPATFVRWSIQALCSSDERFAAYWEALQPGEQSDMLMQTVTKLNAFLTSWPPLRDEWAWRFEEPIQARVGKLKLAARIDLVLGNPKPDGRQSMFLCDLKTGALNDRHQAEADFYALVSTLRHGIPPFRSCSYSLAEGTWTDDPDITETRLWAAADQVIAATNQLVAVLGGSREPELTGGDHCRFCPLADTCPESTVTP